MATATPVDLSTFSVSIPSYDYSPADYPDHQFSVTETGGLVTFQENDADAVLYFFNDSFFVPANATYLSFFYDISLTPDDNDYLQFNVNYAEQFFAGIDGSGGGFFAFDMRPFQGQTIALDWGLIWNGDGSSTSLARVWNIDLASYDSTGGNPVPEPASMLLLGTGLAGLFGARRMRAVKATK